MNATLANALGVADWDKFASVCPVAKLIEQDEAVAKDLAELHATQDRLEASVKAVVERCFVDVARYRKEHETKKRARTVKADSKPAKKQKAKEAETAREPDAILDDGTTLHFGEATLTTVQL